MTPVKYPPRLRDVLHEMVGRDVRMLVAGVPVRGRLASIAEDHAVVTDAEGTYLVQLAAVACVYIKARG